MAYSQNAVRRVQHDMRELQRERVPGLVAAAPADPKDLLVWSVTMRAECGPLEGRDIRMRLSLPPDYPDSPPDVCLLDEIPNHPNVFGDWICLDMLKSPDYYSKPYQGWSAAYSLAGVLQGLYGFLLVDDSVDQMYGGPARSLHTHHAAPPPRPTATVFDAVLRASPALTPTLSPSLSPRASQAAAAAALPDSGAGDDRAASLPSALLQAVQLGGAEAGAAVHDGALEVLDDHLLGHVLANLTPQDLWRCSAAGSARLQQCARDTLQRQELVCFHSKATFREAVLGFGVHREWHASRPGQPLGALRDAVVRLDYLSLDAFATRGVKRSAWNAPLDAFLPLYLNPEHGERALRALPACLAHLSTSRGALSISTLPASVLSSASTSSSSPSSSASRPSSSTTRPDAAAITGMDPRQLLTVLAQLVKSLVVQIVMLQDQQAASRSRQQQAVPDWRRREDPATGNVPTHMSEAALHGFAHLHHLLLAVALAPGGERLLALARGDLEAFCDRPQARHKAQCPDLGVLLVELLLVPKEAVPWSRLMPSLLRELLARQVRWIVRDVGEQAFGVVAGEDLDGASDASFRRMKTHFEKAGTSMRTVLLTCWFSNELARPATVAGAVRELGAIKRAYDATSGLPPPRAGARFHTFAREVLRTGSWGAFLAALRVAVLAVPGCDARGMWARVLRQAVVDSWVQGYHNSPTPWREGTQCRLTPLPRLPRELPATAAASGGGGRGGEGDAAREAPAVKSSGWTEVARAARQPAVASVARAPVRTAPVHSVWPWGPNERLRHAAQNVLGCPFVDWATQPPVRALEGPDAW